MLRSNLFAGIYLLSRAIYSRNEDLKEQARKEYWDACKYPRKKKKKLRKEALLKYYIACSLTDFHF